jgi:hypothetical protein
VRETERRDVLPESSLGERSGGYRSILFLAQPLGSSGSAYSRNVAVRFDPPRSISGSQIVDLPGLHGQADVELSLDAGAS